jgi:hypothetical protein
VVVVYIKICIVSIRVLSNLLSLATPIMTLHLLLFMSNP